MRKNPLVRPCAPSYVPILKSIRARGRWSNRTRDGVDFVKFMSNGYAERVITPGRQWQGEWKLTVKGDTALAMREALGDRVLSVAGARVVAFGADRATRREREREIPALIESGFLVPFTNELTEDGGKVKEILVGYQEALAAA